MGQQCDMADIKEWDGRFIMGYYIEPVTVSPSQTKRDVGYLRHLWSNFALSEKNPANYLHNISGQFLMVFLFVLAQIPYANIFA